MKNSIINQEREQRYSSAAISKLTLVAILVALLIISTLGALYAFGFLGGGITITSTKTATTTITNTANTTITNTEHTSVTTTVTNVTTIYLTYTTTYVTVTNSTTRTLTTTFTSTSEITSTVFSTFTSTLAPAKESFVFLHPAPNSSQWAIFNLNYTPAYVWTNVSGALPQYPSNAALNKTTIGYICTSLDLTKGPNEGVCNQFTFLNEQGWAYNSTYRLLFVHYKGANGLLAANVNMTIGPQGSSPPSSSPLATYAALGAVAAAAGISAFYIYSRKKKENSKKTYRA